MRPTTVMVGFVVGLNLVISLKVVLALPTPPQDSVPFRYRCEAVMFGWVDLLAQNVVRRRGPLLQCSVRVRALVKVWWWGTLRLTVFVTYASMVVLQVVACVQVVRVTCRWNVSAAVLLPVLSLVSRVLQLLMLISAVMKLRPPVVVWTTVGLLTLTPLM